MKNTKILLSLLGVGAITASAASFTSSNVFLGHKSEVSHQENNQIDWKMLNQDTNNYFASLKEANAFGTSDVDRTTMTAALAFAQQKATDYIQRFQAQDLSLEEIISTLAQESPEFAKNYQAQLNNPTTIDDNVDATSMMSAFSNSEISFSFLEQKVKDLKISKTVFITISAVAAVAAAGFWAAAWFFGISVPWAIAATEISTVTGLVASGINAALLKYDKELTKWGKAAITFSIAYKLGHIFPDTLKRILLTADMIVTANSWKVPAALALVPVISSILAWIDLFKW